MKIVNDELLSGLLKKALSGGADYADVYIEHTRPLIIHLEDNMVEKLYTGVDAGVGIRVISGMRSAYAYSNDFSPGALLEMALSVSRAFTRSPTEHILNLSRIRPSCNFIVQSRPDNVDIKKKLFLVEDANRSARKVHGSIRQVSITYRDVIQNVSIASSDGNIAEEERIYTLALIHVIASEGDVLQTGYEPIGGFTGFELFEEISLQDRAVKAAQKAVRMLRSPQASGGRMPVIIAADAGGTMIHEAIGHGLEADLVQQGHSVYAGKKGSLVASPLITIIDDSTLPGKRGSFRFDDEGVPSQKTVLVEKGILKGFLYDRLTALKDGVASTGNGRRESYKNRPIPRMSNTFIAPGNGDPEAIIRSVESGFFVEKMGGGQVNTATGEFVFEVSEGRMIEKGAIGEPVRGATLSGNGADVLKSIDMVGNDLGFSIGTCGKDAQGVPVSDAMPTVRIPEMVVGGSV